MSKEYDTYIIEHRINVKKAYEWLVDHGINFVNRDEMIELIDTHDASKYSVYEYEAYDNYFYGEKTETVKRLFDYAWLHHIHNNPHHWQHWVLVNDEDGTHALEIPDKYVIEMICDWWSFSHKTGDLWEIFNWYDSHKDNMILHHNTRVFVEQILKIIAKKLEEEN